MNKSRKEIEYIVLSELSKSEHPLGAGAIRVLLNDHNIDFGEATVGRFLKHLDLEGYVDKVGFKGRVISEQGRLRLKNLSDEKAKNKNLKDFGSFLSTDDGTYVRDILVARRALESEAAALAAQNASDDDINNIEAILVHMRTLLDSNQSMAVTDVEFHDRIAKASGNKIIETALKVIRHGGKDSGIVEFLRNRAGSQIGKDHLVILEAIRNRDSRKARKLMQNHLDNIIEDLTSYETSVLGDNNHENACSGIKLEKEMISSVKTPSK